MDEAGDEAESLCLSGGDFPLECERSRLGSWRVRSSPVRLGVLLALAIAAPAATARVFTWRSGEATPDHPASFGGRSVYEGRFVVNDAPCALQLHHLPDAPEAAVRRLEAALGRALVWGRPRGGALPASWTDGRAKRRLLLVPGGEGGCLLFVLDARDALASARQPPRWPSELPEVAPTQQPIWVIAHPETRFVFASAVVDAPAIDLLLESCKTRFAEAGWEPGTGAAGGERRGRDSGFALFTKKGKTCWMQARPGPSPQKATLAFLLKSE